MLIALILALATPELQAAKRVSALLRFVARVEEREPGNTALAQRERVERQAAAAWIAREVQLAAPSQRGEADRLSGAAAAGQDREVAWLAGKLQQAIAQRYRWDAVPRQRPSLERGARLYQQACAACHGVDGLPPPGLQLDTRPTAFADSAQAEVLSPQRVFDAVTTGIPETAMPSFEEALGDRDRWSVAFYVTALRHARATGPAPRITLENAALASDALLRAQLEAAGVPPIELESSLARLRWNPPRRHGRARVALVLPGWLVPVSLSHEGEDRIDLALQRPGRRGDVLLLARMVARQALLRASIPLTELSVNVYDGREPVARCALVTLTDYECGVAPAGSFWQ